MGKINILDKHLAELIAAGEVVERPSSVVKELVENAIDAGATAVTVEIKNGGVTFIRVSDNGSGILKEDIRPAFVRHATSKIKDENDLLSIGTLGFRGEALASISSVSHLELITKAREETVGTRYQIEGGEEVAFEDAGCPDGTTFIVRDLFYNVPARMKFLKTDASEGNAVAHVIDKIALSHPEVSITFIKDGKQALKTAGDGKLLSAIYTVYGRDFAKGLIEVDYALAGIRVSGYMSKPEFARNNRNMQNFFINGRFVLCKTAMAAISEASKGAVMIGKFPCCVLNIEMNLEAVDVNVHPTKLEVRFFNERPVFDAVYHAVKTALLGGDAPVKATLKNQAVDPFTLAKKAFRQQKQEQAFNQQLLNGMKENSVSVTRQPLASEKKDEKPDPFSLLDQGVDEKPIDLNPKAADVVKTPFETEPISSFEENQEAVFEKEQKPGPAAEPVSDVRETVEEAQEDPKPLIDVDDESNRFIGEAFSTYIIIEKNPRELLLIDKHAAHERIVFEKLKKEKGSGVAQMLLTPLTVTLDKIDYDAALSHLDVFFEAGFEVEDFGSGALLIRSAPQYLDLDDIEPSVIEMAGYLREHKKEIRSEKMEWIYHNISCRAAVKGGNRNTEAELKAIAEQVLSDEIRHCPHGRPVAIVLTKRELEKQFGRIQ